MPLFGYSQADLNAAYARGVREGQRRKDDAVAHVWGMWCRTALIRGERPPLFCPDEIIAEVRRELHLHRRGL